MLVDLRTFPKLLNEIVPYAILKNRNISSHEVQELLLNKFGIEVTISRYANLFNVEMEEKTLTWVSLKWR